MSIYMSILKQFREKSIEVSRSSWQDRQDNFNFLELKNYLITVNINNINPIKEFCPDLPWADVHFEERISGFPLNPTPSHKMWNCKTEEHLNPEGKFDHTYPERFWFSKCQDQGYRFKNGDLKTLINSLKKNPLTRQAYLPIYTFEDLTAGLQGRRVPCTLGYHFSFNTDTCDSRESYSFDVNYFMRSTDVLRHLNNDLYFTYRLAEYIFREISHQIKLDNFKLGEMTFFTSNLHCFSNDSYTLEKRIKKLS